LLPEMKVHESEDTALPEGVNAMAKGKSKFDFKQLMLKKGEYIALGAAAFFLVLLFGMGVSHWAGAKDPNDFAKEMNTRAAQVQSRMTATDISEEDGKLAEAPEWIKKKFAFTNVPVERFPLNTPLFDPTAKPSTKRENPNVYAIGNYQIDLSRVPMKGYDINLASGDPTIAVIIDKKVSEQDKEERKKLGKTIKGRAGQGKDARDRLNNPNAGGGDPDFGRPGGGFPGGPGGGFPGGGSGGGKPPGGGGFPGGSGGGKPPFGGGGMPGPGGPGNPYGGMGSGFNANEQRLEKAIKYIPLNELDEALDKGEIPAMTVIPLRMVTVYAEVPYKRQLEEIKRALRLANLDEARKWGPQYDGYEVQRRVTRMMPDGTVSVLVDWPTDNKPNYAFEDKYVELINSRKLADQIEDGYLAHFIRYDMNLALPLPELVKELGSYPAIRSASLKEINDAIEKMKKANRPKLSPSDLKNRITGSGDRSKIYQPQSGTDTGADKMYGQSFGGNGAIGDPKGGPKTGPGPAGMPQLGSGGGVYKPGDNGNQATAPPIEIDDLLLRFVDVDVEPGNTYEYRIRLRMLNPNFEREKDVANPAFANVKEMYSPWARINQAITVPAESFLYAADPLAYRTKIKEEYKDQKELMERLQVKDNQAVVEMCQWMEQVLTDSAGKGREPVGAWVVADMPVGRGEYVGRKTYLKLPLWSSESNQYVFREVADKIFPRGPGGREVAQPKGWLVDFTTRSVLVDFEGGKVISKFPNGKIITEDVGTEMLIVRPDGKLLVRSSITDDDDEGRKKIVTGWEDWIKKVSERKASGGAKEDNPFDKPKDKQ
jgi:hypothetical protein